MPRRPACFPLKLPRKTAPRVCVCVCRRAAQLDEDEIGSLRASLGIGDGAFPHLHLSPALRSPKAREALRQPLFSSPRKPRGPHGGGEEERRHATPVATPRRGSTLSASASESAESALPAATPDTLAKGVTPTPGSGTPGSGSEGGSAGEHDGSGRPTKGRNSEPRGRPVPEKLELDDDEEDNGEEEEEEE